MQGEISMKKYIFLAMLPFIIAACSETLPDNGSEDIVEISALIASDEATKVNEAGTEFTVNDVIIVQNTSRTSKNVASFTLAESGSWRTKDVLLWEGYEDNVFKAWFPVEASYDSFAIPADQSDGYFCADWMTADAVAKKSDGMVNLSFSHLLSKVTVTVTGWGDEISSDRRTLSSVSLLSLSSVPKYDGMAVAGDGQSQYVKAFVAASGKSFSAVVSPGTYSASDELMVIYLPGSSAPFIVKAADNIVLESGKAYSYNLTIGRDELVLDERGVSVTDWNTESLADGVAQEAYLEFDGSSSQEINMTFEGGKASYVVKTNVDYEVSVPDWISYTISEGEEGDQLTLDVMSNKELDGRTGTVEIFMPGEELSVSITVHQEFFNGIDDRSFSTQKYMTYVKNYHSYWSGDNLTNHTSIFDCPVSISKITYKFKLPSAPTGSVYNEFMLGSTNRAKDSSVEIPITAEGIGFYDYDEDDDVTYIKKAVYTWAEMGVNSTDVITYTIDTKNDKIIVNEKELSCTSDLSSFGLTCLFSDYYRENDEGVYKDYGGFMEDSRLYYVKIWDNYGRLTYLGGPMMQTNPHTGSTEACWCSTYYNSTTGKLVSVQEFAHYCSEMPSSEYSAFGSGNLYY